MRQIKFRAWSETKKKMFSAEEMARDQLTLLTTGYFINVSGTDTSLSQIFTHEQLLPLQFTGLTDVNGVEIYENDILDIKHFGKYKVCWDDDTACFHTQCIERHGLETWMFVNIFEENTKTKVNIAKVIGNIYENPELLNK